MKLTHIVVAIMTLVLAGCDPEADDVGLFLGDSLMAQATEEIQRELLIADRAIIPVMNSIRGMQLVGDNNYWAGRVRSIYTHMTPSIIFISLGTNDSPEEVYPGWELVAEGIDNMMREVPTGTRVFWILPYSDAHERREEVVAEIEAAAWRWQNLTVLDYKLWLGGENLALADMLLEDGTHLNSDGRKHWARLIEATIKQTL